MWITWISTVASSWENTICFSAVYPNPSDGCTYGGGHLTVCLQTATVCDTMNSKGSANGRRMTGASSPTRTTAAPTRPPNSIVAASVELMIE